MDAGETQFFRPGARLGDAYIRPASTPTSFPMLKFILLYLIILYALT